MLAKTIAGHVVPESADEILNHALRVVPAGNRCVSATTADTASKCHELEQTRAKS